MCTRLIVKGLPANMREDRLRQMFADFGTVTDCKMKFTDDGRFRRFAFVGFDNERDASSARIHFNQTFINASRIQVDECRPFGDESKPRAWSKYAKDSSAYKRANPDDATQVAGEKWSSGGGGGRGKSDTSTSKKVVGDAKFGEFLEVQKNPVEFATKDDEDDGGVTSHVMSEDEIMSRLLDGVTGDTALSLIIRGLPTSLKQKGLKDWLLPIRLKAMKVVRDANQSVVFVTFKRMPDVRRALQRNDQFFGGYKISISKVPANSNQTTDDTSSCVVVDKRTAAETATQTILDTGRLFIRNLSYTCAETDLQTLLASFGELADIAFIVDKHTNKCKGFAVATFVFPENAVAAYAALDGTVFMGRMLHILPGEEKRDDDKDPSSITLSTDSSSSSFKRQLAARQRANLGNVHAWNTLFLGANAIADTIAHQLDASKSELLSGDRDASAGVRLALGETRLVRETREFMLANGVELDAFSRPNAKRSDTVIIAKNLPAGVAADELRRMFERYGEIGRVLLPKDGGVSALIEMMNTSDAKKAFKALSYSRFRTNPLYLEWAPGDVFGASSNVKKQVTSNADELVSDEKMDDDIDATTTTVEDKNNNDDDEEAKKAVVDDSEVESDTTIFVKNLNFETVDEQLRTKFESIGRVRSAVVSRKRDAADPLKCLSFGFGFVQYYRRVDAQSALKELQGVLLDGHCLELKLSHREQIQEERSKRHHIEHADQGDCTKILVRNLPFQATRKELKQLFSAFGELRSIRMPKKVGANDSSHRGFGFVDYLTKTDARRAFDELVHSTHLYGRRLVLEWAKSDESLGELRDKTLDHYASEADRRQAGKLKRKMEKIASDLTVIDDD